VLWTVIAAVASLIAAGCALATVRQTVKLRREAQLQTLAEALMAAISASEKNPGHGKDPVWDARLADAVRQVERVAGLSLLGLSPKITESLIDLLDPAIRQDPDRMFLRASRAFEELLAENGVKPIGPAPDKDLPATAGAVD
jgi:hypothetical protein